MKLNAVFVLIEVKLGYRSKKATTFFFSNLFLRRTFSWRNFNSQKFWWDIFSHKHNTTPITVLINSEWLTVTINQEFLGICSMGLSNLFLIEFIFNCVTIILFKLRFQKAFKTFYTLHIHRFNLIFINHMNATIITEGLPCCTRVMSWCVLLLLV